MNTRELLAREFEIIPLTAKIIAGTVYCLAGAVFWRFSGGSNIPVAGKVILPLIVALPLACYILAVGYVNGDARRRGMRHVLWTLLAIFVPNLIGILLYFLLRDPMPVYCSACGATVRPGFAHCPRCGAQLAATCPRCAKTVEPGWANCAFCGGEL